MSTGKVTHVSKIARDKNQRILIELVSQPGNDICADCKVKAPRWASHNLGIFICVHCASIHRKIGTHVTKVKSLTLDDWTKEQVESMKSIGNIKANQYWNPDEKKHPLPTNMEESERDSELEKYIRSKYEFQRFRPLSTRAGVTEKLGPSQSLQSRTPTLPSSSSHSSTVGSLPKRSQTAPIRDSSSFSSSHPTSYPPVPSAPALDTRSFSSGSAPGNAMLPPRGSSFNPFPSSSPSTSTSTPGIGTGLMSSPAPPPRNQAASLTSSTFNDLISIQAPSLNSSLPLQYTSPTGTQVPMTTGLGIGLSTQSQSPIGPSTTFSSSPFSTPAGGIMTNPYVNSTATGLTPGSNFQSTTLPPFGVGGVQSSLSSMSTGTPNANAFQQQQQPFNTNVNVTGSPNPNPFTQMQMQMQMQQYPGTGTPLASTTPTLLNPNSQPSPFFSPESQPQPQQQLQQQQQQFNMFQSPPPTSTQAQQAQQIFQGMTPTGSGTNFNNPFAQWGGGAL